MTRKVFFLFLICCCARQGLSQSERITGRVLDTDTQEGIPYCNVFYPGTTTGVATDFDGYFELPYNPQYDSLVASAVGYRSLRLPLVEGKYEYRFYLRSASVSLEEVVVYAGENPAHPIVRGIIANKDKNTLAKRKDYRVERYDKVELDLDNIDTEVRQSKFLKPFDFIFENIDSVSDEKPFLPFYVTESITDIYHDNNDNKKREIPLAQKVSGVTNSTVVEFINSMNTDFNIYDNNLEFLGKSFAAPFSDRGFFYYEYYLLDSSYMEGQKLYKLKFKPKRRGEKTFFGEFWVADSTWAVQRLDMRMSDDFNINLVSRVLFFQENTWKNNFWVPGRRKIIVDFTADPEAPGLIGRRTESYEKYRIGDLRLDSVEQVSNNAYLNLSELERSDDYWQEARHVELSENEKRVYSMIDSIKAMPIYETYVDYINFLLTGFVDVGKVELGTIFGLYSYNQIEGHRLRVGMRTTTAFSEEIRLEGALAYGFRDRRFKPTIGLLWLPQKYPRKEFEMCFREAIDFSSTSSEDIVENNLFANIYRRDVYQKLIHIREFKTAYQEYWDNGFSGRLSYVWRDLDPYDNLDDQNNGFNYRYYLQPDRSLEYDSAITTSELNLNLRFAYDEQFIDGNFSRSSIGSKFPIAELQYTYGFSGFFGSEFNYQKLTLNVSHWFNIGTLGWFKYNFKAGQVFGTVPFLLAEVHEGNETYFYSPNAYNGMNKYEFASDRFMSIHLQHHFEGLFLNKIPLLKKLQFREVIEFRAVWGDMSEENLRANAFNLYDDARDFRSTNAGFRPLGDVPYIEMGFGIENILKVLRIDFIYRFNYLEFVQASRFNLRAGFQFYL